MWTAITFIVSEPMIVTTAAAVAHAGRVVWANLPAITTVLRAAGAALGVAAGIRALCRRCGQHENNHTHPNRETRR